MIIKCLKKHKSHHQSLLTVNINLLSKCSPNILHNYVLILFLSSTKNYQWQANDLPLIIHMLVMHLLYFEKVRKSYCSTVDLIVYINKYFICSSMLWVSKRNSLRHHTSPSVPQDCWEMFCQTWSWHGVWSTAWGSSPYFDIQPIWLQHPNKAQPRLQIKTKSLTTHLCFIFESEVFTHKEKRFLSPP